MHYVGKKNEAAAVRWMKESLRVNPHCRETQRMVADLEARAAESWLRPRIQAATSELRGERGLSISPPGARVGKSEDAVRSIWDVHRVVDVASPPMNVYLFRIRLESRTQMRASSLARLYVLKVKNASGDISPLPVWRVTPWPGGFSMGPEESYQYSFMLRLGPEIMESCGGVLVQCGDELVETPLESVTVSNAQVVEMDKALEMTDGYEFFGCHTLH